MFAKHFIGALGLAATLSLSTGALAADGPVTLDSTVKLDKLVTEGGQTKHQLVEPKKVVPGNHLVFLTTYHNSGAKPVTRFVVTNPLPAAVVLADDATGGFEASVDGGKSWGQLPALRLDDGKGGKRAAQASDVTHVRWVVPVIAPGASGTREYHAVVR